MKTLGEKIKNLRKDNNMTQSDLGKILNIAKSTISQYENNINTPDINMLKKISKVFDVSLDYLVNNSPADKIKKAISDDPELADAWEKLSQREDLQLLFKQTKDMNESDIRQVIRIIKAIEDEEEQRYNGG